MRLKVAVTKGVPPEITEQPSRPQLVTSERRCGPSFELSLVSHKKQSNSTEQFISNTSEDFFSLPRGASAGSSSPTVLVPHRKVRRGAFGEKNCSRHNYGLTAIDTGQFP